MRSTFLLATLCLTAAASAQTNPLLTLKPWPDGAAVQTHDHILYQTEADVRGEPDRKAEVFWWDSIGRWRFDRTDPNSWALGYHWATMDFNTNSFDLPRHLDDLSLALGAHVGELAGGSVWLIGGAGYASNSPFSDTNGIFGIGHVQWVKPIGAAGARGADSTTADSPAADSIVLSLDYSGNASFIPDAPLPGIEWLHQAKSFSSGVGFPHTWIEWEILPRLTLDASYEVPFTGDVSLEYHVTDEWSVFGGYSHFFNGFFLRDVPKTDRVFYEMSRVETGVRYNGTIFGFSVDAAVTVGYAFEQNFYRGFDARDLDSLFRISDEPFIGLVLVSRF